MHIHIMLLNDMLPYSVITYYFTEYFSLSVHISLSLYLPFSVSLCVSLSIYLSISPSLSIYLYLSYWMHIQIGLPGDAHNTGVTFAKCIYLTYINTSLLKA